MTDATNAEYVTVNTVEELRALDPKRFPFYAGGEFGFSYATVNVRTCDDRILSRRLPATVLTPATRPSGDVVDAVMGALGEHSIGETWGDDGVSFVGCDCGQWFGKAVDGGLARAEKHYAEAILSAVPKPRVSADVGDFLDWLISMDDEAGRSARQTVTLTSIIERARKVRAAGIEVEK